MDPPLVAPPHPVRVQGGPGPEAFQGGIAFFPRKDLHPKLPLQGLLVQGGPEGLFLLGEGAHLLVEAGDQDLPVFSSFSRARSHPRAWMGFGATPPKAPEWRSRLAPLSRTSR